MDLTISKSQASAKGIWKKSLKIDPSKCFISCLPEELLIKIFSFLDPDTLNIVSWVCSSWNKTIRNEIIWKEAFIDRFGYIPYEKVSNGGWREEFTTRMNLIDLWKRGKPNIIEYRCMYPFADIFYANFKKRRLYVGWLNQGLISISDPNTGRNERHKINLFGDFMPQPVSCVKIDKNNIVVGEFGGGITRISNFKDNLKNMKQKKYSQSHNSPITCIEWISTYNRVVATGSMDGQVMLWDTKNNIRLAILSSGYTSQIDSIIIDPKRYIIAGNVTGQIQVWKINIFELLSDSRVNITTNTNTNDKYIPLASEINVKNPILSLHYDYMTETIVVACRTGPLSELLTHWNISTGKKLNTFKNGHLTNELTAVSWTKERQGASSNNERSRLMGIDIDQSNPELYGLEGSIICSADISGRVCFWNFEKRVKKDISDHSNSEEFNHSTYDNMGQPMESFEKSPEDGSNLINPTKVYDIHEGPVTSILIDSFKIITSGCDGTINIFDSLCNELVRKFHCRKAKNNPRNANVMRGLNQINGMDMDKYQVCINFGNNIKVWDFDTERVKESKKKQKKTRELLSAKLMKHNDLISDFKESYQMMEIEKKNEKINMKNSKRFNGSINEYLTEDEMLKYAMMLSLEEKEKEEKLLIENGIMNDEEIYTKNENDEENDNDYENDYENDYGREYEPAYSSNGSYSDNHQNSEFEEEWEDASHLIYGNNENYDDGDSSSNVELTKDNTNNKGKGAMKDMSNNEDVNKEFKEKLVITKNKDYFNTPNLENQGIVESSTSDFIHENTNSYENHISSVASSTNTIESNQEINNWLDKSGKNKVSLNVYSTPKPSNSLQEDDSKNTKDLEETVSSSPSNETKKRKKNKNNKKKKNFIPLDEWEETNHDYSMDPAINTMNEEEYLEYVLQLSLHDK